MLSFILLSIIALIILLLIFTSEGQLILGFIIMAWIVYDIFTKEHPWWMWLFLGFTGLIFTGLLLIEIINTKEQKEKRLKREALDIEKKKIRISNL